MESKASALAWRRTVEAWCYERGARAAADRQTIQIIRNTRMDDLLRGIAITLAEFAHNPAFDRTQIQRVARALGFSLQDARKLGLLPGILRNLRLAGVRRSSTP